MSPKKTSKYMVYYRVSTKSQGRSGLGIDAQREAVKAYLERVSGYPPVAEFIETESGRKTKRVALDKALAACRVHRARLVIAKLDRLARNLNFLMTIYDSDVGVGFCDLPDVPPGPTGRFIVQQMASVAELEAGLISERTKAALAAKVARDGQWNRKAKHHLVPGIGQAVAVQALKERAAQAARDLEPIITEIRGEGADSLRQIAAKLTARDIPTPRGGKWTAASVRNALKRLERAQSVS